MLRKNYVRLSAKQLTKSLEKLCSSATVRLSDDLYCSFTVPDNNVLVEQADCIFVKVDADDVARYLDAE